MQNVNHAAAQGLSAAEVTARQAAGQDNRQPAQLSKSTWQIVKDNVFTAFNAINALIGLCLLLVRSYENMFFLLVIALNSLIGVVQELRARRAVEKLTLISSPNARVLRDGAESSIPFEQIVLDDCIVLDSGQQICADAVVLSGNIEVNESLLTGEADSIAKGEGAALLSGSYVIAGRCLARVVHVGESNYATQITQAARAYKPLHSDLFTSLQKVFKVTGLIIPPVGILLFLQAWLLRGDGLTDAVVSTAAALLGMLPKGLMLLSSMSLALSVYKLATRSRTLVRDLYSIETLAHVDTLCLDKTGTLTQGQMSVSQLIPAQPLPAPWGQDSEAALAAYLAASTDNNATSQALRARFGREDAPLATLHGVPFASERKWGAVNFAAGGALLLGAPDILLPADLPWPEEVRQAHRQAQRILCLAHSVEHVAPRQPLPTNLQPSAWILLQDPLRHDAADTLQLFTDEGVDIKIISGDHPATVSAIAQQLRLPNAQHCADASAWQSEDELRQAATQCHYFGRVRPEQKLALIRALQQEGHQVAMTGDGVNDVLALKTADCSIAMAAGSDVARQVAQVVLVDSTLSSLPDVLMEGRRVVNNITRVSSLFFMKTVYSILLSLLSVLLGMPFPFIPIQITLIDLALEGYPSFFLALEPRHEPIGGSFLETVFRRAAPSGMLLTLYIVFIQLFAGRLGISAGESVTVMYGLLGWSAVVLQYRTVRPLNALRSFLLITSGAGFFVAAYLFRELLALLTPLSPGGLLLFGVLALLTPLLCALLSRCYDWVLARWRRRKSSRT